MIRFFALLLAPAVLSASAPISGTIEHPVRMGDVVVVEGSDHSRVLTRGGSATTFSLRLPAGAACPGDSLHDQWRIQSFIVPATVDPAHLTYDLTAPHGDGYLPLLTHQRPYMQDLTNANPKGETPGVLPAPPPFSLERLNTTLLKPGVYRVGLACTYFRDTAQYWDTAMTFTADATDSPGGFVWSSAPAAAVPSAGGSTAWWFVIALGVVGVVVVGAVLRRRRHLAVDPSSPAPPDFAHNKESR